MHSATPYPELNAVLQELVAGMEAILDETFVAACLQGSFANDTALIEHVHALLDTAAAADHFSGAVLVAHEDQPLVITARSYAIHPNVLPNQRNTKFDIASVIKMFFNTRQSGLMSNSTR
jgi:CubicO group peptidase (beta-lactamase class C family)